mmetsp:Transcript_41037/g.36379  ORF Transcript_41037/g.36379 Transcript_41037/m.36379 type:complete len:86 (+) Transcript_41037:156-413(+)
MKVIHLGDVNSGKTSLFKRMSDKSSPLPFPVTTWCFPPQYSYKYHGINVMLELWDTCGQERFISLHKYFKKDTNGIMLCFSVGNR